MFQVTPGSISDQCGLKAGDTVLQIGSRPSDELPHDEAKRQILMAGDNFSMIIKRYDQISYRLQAGCKQIYVAPFLVGKVTFLLFSHNLEI